MPIPDESGSRQPSIPAAVRRISLTDFDQVESCFSSWQGRIEQLSSGRFSGSLQVVQGSLVRLMAIEANQQVLLRGRNPGEMFSVYPVNTGNSGSVWQGHQLTPGQLVLIGIDVESNHLSALKSQNLGVTLRAVDLQEAARILLADDAAELPNTWTAFSPSPVAFAALNEKLSSLLKLGVADPRVIGTPEGHRLEQECIRSVVASVFSLSARSPALSLRGRSLLIRRAEEFMRSRLVDPVGAVDLCRELGVSDRTLRLAFHERFGLGPMVYYKSLRLNAVRARLKESPQTTVAEAAREFGFHHLGNFAYDYRRQFGERPSQTDRQGLGLRIDENRRLKAQWRGLNEFQR